MRARKHVKQHVWIKHFFDVICSLLITVSLELFSSELGFTWSKLLFCYDKHNQRENKNKQARTQHVAKLPRAAIANMSEVAVCLSEFAVHVSETLL